MIRFFKILISNLYKKYKYRTVAPKDYLCDECHKMIMKSTTWHVCNGLFKVNEHDYDISS